MSLLKTMLLLAALAGSLATGAATLADEPTEKTEEAKLRVGTFDSRAVAAAFLRSEMFNRQLQQRMQEHQKAKAAGDEEKVKKLEAEGKSGQQQAHRQGFGTAPVDDILQHIRDKLPGIAKRANVDVIVSKWAITYSAPDAHFVDITEPIIEPFQPNEQTKRVIRQLLAKPPVPLEEIDKHHDH